MIEIYWRWMIKISMRFICVDTVDEWWSRLIEDEWLRFIEGEWLWLRFIEGEWLRFPQDLL
jgi:hypothetical protein